MWHHRSVHPTVWHHCRNHVYQRSERCSPQPAGELLSGRRHFLQVARPLAAGRQVRLGLAKWPPGWPQGLRRRSRVIRRASDLGALPRQCPAQPQRWSEAMRADHGWIPVSHPSPSGATLDLATFFRMALLRCKYFSAVRPSMKASRILSGRFSSVSYVFRCLIYRQ